jgi:protein arginine N-methyltransferase 1
MWSVLDEHRSYLADPVRVRAYERALREVVTPGAVVVDLGAGTGVLGLLALRAGAACVYAIESTDLVELTRSVYAANGFADQVRCLKGRSTEIDLAEPADVVVADQLGPFGFEAGVLECFADARRRFLRPEGMTIPRALTFWAAPVECPAKGAELGFWDDGAAGIDVTAVRRLVSNATSTVDLTASELLAPPADLGALDPSAGGVAGLTLEGSTVVHRPGTVHGVAGWFEATLSSGVTMTNSPLATQRIDRVQAFLPVESPTEVVAGDVVAVTVDARPAAATLRWRVCISRGGAVRASFDQSTFKGMLLSREELERTRPGSRPVLSERGRARLATLELCDGTRSLTEVEEEIRRGHPRLVPTAEAAQAFVARVVARNSA